jgi:hypothetical protein
MEVFTYIGMLTVGFAAWFVHVACREIFRPYRRFCITVSDIIYLPYLMVRVLFYTDAEIQNLSRYFKGLMWSTRLMNWWLAKQMKRRVLLKTNDITANVTGNTPDFGSGESTFEPWQGN